MRIEQYLAELRARKCCAPTEFLYHYATNYPCVYASIPTQEHSKLRSPNTLSIWGKANHKFLLSSPIFEYEVISGGIQSPLEQCHLLVWFNVYPEKTILSAQKAEPWLLRLLCIPSFLPCS